MAVGEAHVFPGFLTPTFFQNPPTTFLTFFRGERRKYAGKKVRLNRVSHSQPPCNESNILIIEPPGRGYEKAVTGVERKLCKMIEKETLGKPKEKH